MSLSLHKPLSEWSSEALFGVIIARPSSFSYAFKTEALHELSKRPISPELHALIRQYIDEKNGYIYSKQNQPAHWSWKIAALLIPGGSILLILGLFWLITGYRKKGLTILLWASIGIAVWAMVWYVKFKL